MEKAEEQKGESGLDLMETVVGGKYPHCNTWSLPGGAVWEGLGSAASLERVCHWGWALRLRASGHFQFTLCFLHVVEVCTVPRDARREHQNSRKWSYILL